MAGRKRAGKKPVTKTKRANTGSAKRKAIKKPAKPARSRDRVKATERAIKELGEDRLRAGKVRVSRSRWVTPTSRGLGSGSVAKTLNRIAKVPGDPFFSYTVKTRFRGRDGKRKTVTLEGLGVPRLADAARLRRRKRTAEDKRRKRKASGRKETTREALRRLVRDQIQREVLAAVRKEWGTYTLSGDPRTKMGRAKARRQLARIKQRRMASFQVEFDRVVRPRGTQAARARKAPARAKARPKRTTARAAPVAPRKKSVSRKR